MISNRSQILRYLISISYQSDITEIFKQKFDVWKNEFYLSKSWEISSWFESNFIIQQTFTSFFVSISFSVMKISDFSFLLPFSRGSDLDFLILSLDNFFFSRFRWTKNKKLNTIDEGRILNLSSLSWIYLSQWLSNIFDVCRSCFDPFIVEIQLIVIINCLSSWTKRFFFLLLLEQMLIAQFLPFLLSR